MAIIRWQKCGKCGFSIPIQDNGICVYKVEGDENSYCYDCVQKLIWNKAIDTGLLKRILE